MQVNSRGRHSRSRPTATARLTATAREHPPQFSLCQAQGPELQRSPTPKLQRPPSQHPPGLPGRPACTWPAASQCCPPWLLLLLLAPRLCCPAAAAAAPRWCPTDQCRANSCKEVARGQELTEPECCGSRAAAPASGGSWVGAPACSARPSCFSTSSKNQQRSAAGPQESRGAASTPALPVHRLWLPGSRSHLS